MMPALFFILGGAIASLIFAVVLIIFVKKYFELSSLEKAQNAAGLQKYYIPQILAFAIGTLFLLFGYLNNDPFLSILGSVGTIMGIVGLFLRKRYMDVNAVAENFEKHKKINNIIFVSFLALLVVAGIIEKSGVNLNFLPSYFRNSPERNVKNIILLSKEQLKNTEYYYDLDHRPLQGVAKLDSGLYNKTGDLISDQFSMELSDKDIAFGDLNADGIPDAAVILYKTSPGIPPLKEAIVAAVLNQDGQPWLNDEVNIGTYNIASIKINNGVIELSGAERSAGLNGDVIKNADYQYKLIGSSLYGTDLSHPLDNAQGTKKFILIKGVNFDIPANFNLWEGSESIIDGENFNFNKESTYPKTGATISSGCLGNYKYPTYADTDKILRQRIAGAIEICISLRNGYLAQRRPFQRANMQTDSYGIRETVSLEVGQTPENHYADIVDLTIRSADFSQGPQIENILVGILKSAEVDGKKLWPE